MGNINVSQQKQKDDILNHIASNYIFTQNFQDLQKLSDINYCNKLVELTSNNILNNFDIAKINQTSKQIQNTNTTENNKQNMCNNIAKFYVKIAHLFAAIYGAVNNDDNMCNSKIKMLINNVKNENIPDFCDNNSSHSPLTKEKGIIELEKLYFDKYNSDKNIFGGHLIMENNMTPEMMDNYNKDLLLFYRAFTGNDEIPMETKVIDGKEQTVPTITKFKDINLNKYHECKKNVPKQLIIGKKNKLLNIYANHINQMLKKTENNKNELLKIINKIFIINESDNQVTINPTLNEQLLQSLIEDTRNIIVNLYITCEEDYAEGLDIFEAIIEKQIMETTLQQIKNLKQLLENDIENNI